MARPACAALISRHDACGRRGGAGQGGHLPEPEKSGVPAAVNARKAAWFNFSIFAGDKSWVAGVELATAGEPPARKPRIWGGVALRASTPATPRCNLLLEPCRFVRRFLGRRHVIREALPDAIALSRLACRVPTFVGQDSNLVVGRIINDTIGIVSHDRTGASLCHRLAALPFIAATRLQVTW